MAKYPPSRCALQPVVPSRSSSLVTGYDAANGTGGWLRDGQFCRGSPARGETINRGVLRGGTGISQTWVYRGVFIVVGRPPGRINTCNTSVLILELAPPRNLAAL